MKSFDLEDRFYSDENNQVKNFNFFSKKILSDLYKTKSPDRVDSLSSTLTLILYAS